MEIKKDTSKSLISKATPPKYKSPHQNHQNLIKSTLLFCYELPKATIKHQRMEEVEKHFYTWQN